MIIQIDAENAFDNIYFQKSIQASQVALVNV